MKIKVGKSGNVLKAADQSDLDVINSLEEGCAYIATLQRIRNPKLHRKYFALLGLAFDNQEVFKDFEVFRKFLEMCAGHYEVAYVPNRTTGEIIQQYWPRSIAYAALDQTEFEALYEKVIAEISTNFGFDPETFDKEAGNQ